MANQNESIKVPDFPITNNVIRVAVGAPGGLSSNAWRIWCSKNGDVYIKCRDNFKEAKVSLHVSGRWRMGFTTEALEQNPGLLPEEANRAWEVWDCPEETIPNTVKAFALVFPAEQLVVRPAQRDLKSWKNVIFIEAAPPGKLTVVSLFVTRGNVSLQHESEPSIWLASFDLGNGSFAQLVAHGELECNLPQVIANSVAQSRLLAERAGRAIPEGAYAYFLGHREDGMRYICGATLDEG